MNLGRATAATPAYVAAPAQASAKQVGSLLHTPASAAKAGASVAAVAKHAAPAAAGSPTAKNAAPGLITTSATAKHVTGEPGLYVSGTGPVIVDIRRSDSGYSNKLYWSSDNWATRNYLGIDNQTASINIGSFAKGTRIEFGIENDLGQFFRSGSGAANPDQFQHAQVTTSAQGLTIGFEDLLGGGDRDFNDAILSVRGLINNDATAAPKPDAGSTPKPAPVVVAPSPATPDAGSKPKPAPVVVTPNPATPGAGSTPKPAPVVVAPNPPAPEVSKSGSANNRSGLGDGTNPGQGAGRANSPNVGTENPNQANKSTKKTTTPSEQDAQLTALRTALMTAALTASQATAVNAKQLNANTALKAGRKV